MGTRNKTKIIEKKRTRSKSKMMEIAAIQEREVNCLTRQDKLNEKCLEDMKNYGMVSSVNRLEADANINITLDSFFNIGNTPVIVVRTKGGSDVLIINGKMYHAEIMLYHYNEDTEKHINRTSDQIGLQQTDLDGATINEID